MDALRGHLAGEEAAFHRRVDDYAYIVIFAIWEYFVIHATVDQVVWRLERLDRGDLLYPFHLPDVEVRYTGVSDFAFFFEFGERFPSFLDVLVGVGPVDLVQVDDVRLEPPQAIFALPLDRVFLEYVAGITVLVPDQRTLRKHVGFLSDAFQRLGHQLLGVAQPVDGGGVDPVDAQLQRALYCSHGFFVVLGSPGGAPSAAADGPTAEADGRYVHVRLAELYGLQPSSFGSSTAYMFKTASR